MSSREILRNGKMKERSGGHKFAHTENNAGFSLVEVLVAVAIIAIISVPILNVIKNSAQMNFKAHETQQMTDIVQEELEIIKSSTLAEYQAMAGGAGYTAIDLSDVQTYDPALYNAASDAVTNAGGSIDASLRDPVFYTKDVHVANSDYVMLIGIEPARYSQASAGGVATDVNVAEIMDVADADSAKYAVISEDLSRYEKDSLVDSVYTNDMLEAVFHQNVMADASLATQRDVELPAIADALQKDVEITVDEAVIAADEEYEVRVQASITYTYDRDDDGTAEGLYTYPVYDHTYRYNTVSPDEAYDHGASYIPEGEHAYVFIFANAFEPLVLGDPVSVSTRLQNNVTITRTGDSDLPVDTVFVRTKARLPEGVTSLNTYNFDSINLDPGGTYMTLGGASPDGEMAFGAPYGGEKLLTNVKDSLFISSDPDASIGKGNKKLRSSYISVGLYGEIPAGGYEREAFSESTKIER